MPQASGQSTTNSETTIAEPSPWVRRFLSSRSAGSLLDLAAGRGRHTLLALSMGHQVTAVDLDLQTLRAHSQPGLTCLEMDLETGAPWPFLAQRFDTIIVTNYLHRPTLPQLPSLLAPGGWLIYEAFAVGHEHFGRPTNPDFLLQPGELLDRFADQLTILAFEQGRVTRTSGPAMVQRITARNERLTTATVLPD